MTELESSGMTQRNSNRLPRFFLASIFIGMASSLCRGEEFPIEPEVVIADLDGDGHPETISRVPSGPETEAGTFFHLVVKDASGTILWKSPHTRDTENPLAFGEWHFGISLPQLAADVDGDGRPELIVPAPQSDVSPTFFRVFRWTGKAFEPLQSKAISGKGRKGAIFKWSDDPPLSNYWVQQWLGASAEGGLVVELVSMPDGADLRIATAVLALRAGGFELVRWIRPPSKPGEIVGDQAAVPAGGAYRARLSARDHVNSSGSALKKVIDILRQDRANVHRGTHRDAEDQMDDRFACAQARETLASMPVTVSGGARAEARIVGGTPIVEVQVTNGEVRVEIVSD